MRGQQAGRAASREASCPVPAFPCAGKTPLSTALMVRSEVPESSLKPIQALARTHGFPCLDFGHSSLVHTISMHGLPIDCSPLCLCVDTLLKGHLRRLNAGQMLTLVHIHIFFCQRLFDRNPLFEFHKRRVELFHRARKVVFEPELHVLEFIPELLPRADQVDTLGGEQKQRKELHMEELAVKFSAVAAQTLEP